MKRTHENASHEGSILTGQKVGYISAAWSQVFVSNLGIQGLTLITSILITRELGPENRGLFSELVAWVMLLAAVLSSGAEVALVKTSNARAHSRGNFFFQLFVICFIAWCCTTIVLVVNEFRSGEHTKLVIFIASLAVPASVLSNVIQSLLLDRGFYRQYSRGRVAFYIVNLGCIIFVMLANVVSVTWLLTSFVVAGWAAALILAASAYNSTLFSKESNSRNTIKSIFITISMGKPYMLATLLNAIVINGPLLVIVHAEGAVSGGYFAAALVIAGVPNVLGVTSASLVFGKVKGRREDRCILVDQLVKITAFHTIFACVIIVLCSKLVLLVYGPSFQLAEKLIPWLALAMIISSVVAQFESFFRATANGNALISARIGFIFTFAAGFLVVFPLHDLRGIAILICASYLVECLIYIRSFNRSGAILE